MVTGTISAIRSGRLCRNKLLREENRGKFIQENSMTKTLEEIQIQVNQLSAQLELHEVDVAQAKDHLESSGSQFLTSLSELDYRLASGGTPCEAK
jgi:hypothetical protein